MGSLALSDFRTAVADAMGSAAYGNTKFDRWINAGYLELSNATEHQELELVDSFNTANGTASYTLAANVLVVKSLRLHAADVPLRYMRPSEFDKMPQLTTGQPIRWTRKTGSIIMSPIPTSILAVDRFEQKLPAKLVNVNDTTVLKDNWDWAVYLLAVSNGFMGQGQDTRGVLWLQRAVSYIQTQIGDTEWVMRTRGIGTTLPPLSEEQLAGV